jgi:hypothetical protein
MSFTDMTKSINQGRYHRTENHTDTEMGNCTIADLIDHYRPCSRENQDKSPQTFR